MPQFISLQKAIDMTSFYRAQKENILIPQLRNQKITPLCETLTDLHLKLCLLFLDVPN